MAGSERSSCGVLRRLAAITYDALLLFGVLFLATIIVMVIFKPAEIQASHLFFPVYLLFVCYLYFVWQWVHGRQTLGMKAWKIMLTNADTGMVNWKTASLRFLLALVSLIPFAFGLLWIILDSENVTFYDRYSKTRLIKLG